MSEQPKQTSQHDPSRKEQKPPADQSRKPIPIERLVFTSPNPHGVKLPDGLDGRGERILPNLTAGDHGGVKIEIEWRPWVRVFRVTRSKKVTHTGKDGEIVTFEAMGKPFHVPDTWAVSV